MMESVVEPSLVIEALAVLTTAEPASKHEGTDTKMLSGPRLFDDLLVNNISQLKKQLEPGAKLNKLQQPLEHENIGGLDDVTDNRWIFVQWNLKLFKILREALSKAVKRYAKEKETQSASRKGGADPVPPMSPDTITFSQQKVISTSLQFVVSLGLCPNLLPGVGLPIEIRSGFGKLLQVTELGPELEREERDFRLWQCTDCLLNCLEVSSLGTIILSRHLGDILAALCQLSYAPIPKKPSPPFQELSEQKGVGTASQDASTDTACSNAGAVREKCQQQLSMLIDRVYQPLLVRELLILQGGPPPRMVANKSVNKPQVLAKSPVWLRKVCGRILSDRLMKPNGVQNVLRGMLDTTGAVGRKSTSSPDWKKCDAVAKVIATCPKQGSISTEDYYRTVCPQILELIRVKDKLVSQQFLRVAVSTLSEMYVNQPQLTVECAMKPLMGPLLAGEGTLQVRDEELVQLIEDIHKVFVIGCGPQSVLVQCLQPQVHTLYKLYCFLQQAVTHERKLIEEVLLVSLKQQDDDRALACLQLLALNKAPQRFDFTPTAAQFNPSETGCILVFWDKSKCPEIQDWELSSRCFIDLLKQLGRENTTAEFFLSILKELTAIISAEVDDTDIKLPMSLSGNEAALTDIEHRQSRALAKIQHNLTVLSLLTIMCEELGHSCFQNATHILEFVQATLERAVKVIQKTADAALSLFETETLTMAMGLLTAVIGGTSEMSERDRVKSKELLPSLQQINASHPDSGVKNMAADLQVAIATHGKVWSGARPDANKPLSDVHVCSRAKKSGDVEGLAVGSDPCDAKPKPLIEVIDSTDSKGTSNDAKPVQEIGKEYPQVADEAPNAENNKLSMLQEALTELEDPLVPVQGHALITLRKLIDIKDAETLSNQDLLLKIFREHVDHEDSYIYLGAVQGLASLGDRFPAKVLPVLLEDYAIGGGEGQKVKRSSECRMKLGEVLVKVSRALGETIPHYREPLLNAILSSTRDQDPLVRASSVSNLGEICKLLHYSLGGVIQEVLACVSTLVKSDPEVEVRRSAAMFTTLLLRGLGQDTVKVLDESIRELYRLLKHVVTVDKDDVVRLHVQLSLEELDGIMKELLFPKQTLEKRIRVLDP